MTNRHIGLVIATAVTLTGIAVATVYASPGDQGSVPVPGIKDLPTAPGGAASLPTAPTVVPTSGSGGTPTTVPTTTAPPTRVTPTAADGPPVLGSATSTTKRRPGSGGVLPSLAQEPGGSQVPQAPWAP
ncbi:hypothetical protein ACQP2U_43025 (plasmid) [Nocardia sp. CA-084685]|uniref:hypothetical protein n=1 Tax=Nocardia sp. CA-084685 TaxID=3239970 RepID=UPI003D9808C1